MARWHTRRCLRLMNREPPADRAWDLLLLSEEVDDVLAECARLETSGDTQGMYGVLSTLDEAVCAQVRTLLFDHRPVVLPLHRPA